MKYRNNNQEDDLSILGFGCMRFPKKGNSIDMAAVNDQIMYAINHGINYFDTAYVYTGSEVALGTVLANNKCRDQVKIATKLPHYMVKKQTDFDKYFEEELKRLQTDYIDYYLMHMLPDVNIWNNLVKLGVLEWIEAKKQSGQIKHIGFSYHGSTDGFIEVLDVFDWDFCQIQYNYMDEHSQAGRKGLMAAAAKNIAIIIMEPLRGGSLVKDLPKKAIDTFNKTLPTRSPAEWAFRWLWDQPEVSCILSGMNSMEMIKENIKVASEVEVRQLSEDDFKVYEAVKEAINEKTKVPCTACSYCMPCPFGVDIPGCFRCYNVSYTDGYTKGLLEYALSTTFRNKQSIASLCTECGACEKHCPQSIPIRADLKKVRRRFESPIFKAVNMYIKKRYK